MKRRRAISPALNDFIERSLIIGLALIALIALSFLYGRKAFAAEIFSASQLLVSQVQPAPNPSLENQSEQMDRGEIEDSIDDTIVPPADSTVAIQVQQDLPVTENSVLAQLHNVNQMEIEMGNLAKENATGDLIKRYAHRVFADHRYVDQRLLNLAESLEMDLTASPIEPAPDRATHSAKMSTLASTSGATFDGTFLEMMEEGHRHAIDLLMNARNQLPVDSKVRLFAGQIIPILQQHLDVVTHLQEKK